jgi:hypothetical protein
MEYSAYPPPSQTDVGTDSGQSADRDSTRLAALADPLHLLQCNRADDTAATAFIDDAVARAWGDATMETCSKLQQAVQTAEQRARTYLSLLAQQIPAHPFHQSTHRNTSLICWQSSLGTRTAAPCQSCEQAPLVQNPTLCHCWCFDGGDFHRFSFAANTPGVYRLRI